MNFRYGKKEVDYLKAKDRKLGAVIDRIGHVRFEVDGDLFSGVVGNIVAQQISGKAFATIMQRMAESIGDITAESLSKVETRTIQRCGMSMKKAEYIKDFAVKVASGAFDLARVAALPDNEVIAALSSLRGIGVWTAEMLLLFCLQRPDVLSFGDFGIQKGMRMVYRHRKITKALFQKCRRRLSPYGSVASFYFWSVANGELPDLTDPASR